MSERIRDGVLALAYSLALLVATGLVPSWGRWYAPDPAYRAQTEALFRGALSIHTQPQSLTNDLAWHNGGVHQVWGLGVPLWRLPFEALAKCAGQGLFPDRLAFGAALTIVAYAVARRVRRHLANVPPPPGHDAPGGYGLLAAATLLLFPPFVAMCRGCFNVYEEAVAYSYLCGIGLFLGLWSYRSSPSLRKILGLSLLAGFAPWVRPTLGFYGLATMIVLTAKRLASPRERRAVAMGWGLFGLGVALLLATNHARFGSAGEFGHRLNLNAPPIWYFTRIHNPFQDEPLGSAVGEWFGALFCRPELNGFAWNADGLFWGQSTTARWRHFYTTAFDLTYPVFLVSAGLLGCRANRRPFPAASPESFRWAVGWMAISALLLTGFYLRAPVLSNRYLMDYGPAFAVAVFVTILGIAGGAFPWLERHPRARMGIPSALVLWLVLEIMGGKTVATQRQALTREETLAQTRTAVPRERSLPGLYRIGENPRDSGISYNGAGWDFQTGELETLAVFFVDTPEALQLIVRPAEGPAGQAADASRLLVRVGLETLTLESSVPAAGSTVLTFRAPQRAVYRHGTQAVFVAYRVPGRAYEQQAPLRLLRLRWRRSGTAPLAEVATE